MGVCVSLDYYRIESKVAIKHQVISELLTRITDGILPYKRNNSLTLRELLGVELIGIKPTTY